MDLEKRYPHRRDLKHQMVTHGKEAITLTHNSSILFLHNYLIRVNNIIVGFVDNLDIGIKIIDRVADRELKIASERTSSKLLKYTLNQGREIQICSQSSSWWKGEKVKKIITIDMVPVPRITYHSS